MPKILLMGAQADDREFDEFNAELKKLRDDPQEVLLHLDKIAAWVVLCQLQLALRHPENKGATAEIARNVAMSIQEALCPEPESVLAMMAQSGWEERRIIVPQ